MKTFNDFAQAVRGAMAQKLHVAVYAGPNAEPRFFCSNELRHSGEGFFVVPWLEKFASRQVIAPEITAEEAAASANGDFVLSNETTNMQVSTSKANYLAGLNEVISDCRATGGKTVISTISTIAATKDIEVARAMEFLDKADCSTFRCFFSVSPDNVWIVASPELLLNYNNNDKTLKTMALAGTRASGAKDWSDKNSKEQAYVTNFITSVLDEFGDVVYVSRPDTLAAGNVEHIVTHIEAKLDDIHTLAEVLDVLSPTPAVCGVPREHAIEIINRYEQHKRNYYGGYFGVQETDQSLTASVMLRCAQLSRNIYNVYAGGGITAKSVAEGEWYETRLKAKQLTEFF